MSNKSTPNKAVINKSSTENSIVVNQSNSSFRDTDDLRYVIRQPMIWGDPPPEVNDLEQEVESNGDVVDRTQLERSPPSKRARYFFKKCFEATFNPSSVPGSDNILAPDSDEENM